MKVRVQIQSDTIPLRVTAAQWDTVLRYTPQDDQIFFNVEVGQMVFVEADYCEIYGAGDCEEIDVIVQRDCGSGEFVNIWTGKFSRFDCEIDEDRQKITVTPTPVNLRTCFLDWWQTEVNIYDAGPETVARGVIGRYEAGLYPCYICRATPDVTPCNTHTDACIEYSVVAAYPSPRCPEPNRYEVQTMWHREIGVGTGGSPPPYKTGWSLLSGTDWWRCPDTSAISLGVYRYGRLLNDVLEHIVGLAICDNPITVRSHFFGLNNTHLSPPPGVPYDFAGEYLQNITMHQKSDVKRPDGDKSFSKVWTLKPKDLLDDLRRMFNVYWDIQGTPEEPELILEHISYFETGVGLDYSAKKIRRKYKQDESGIPKTERFKFSDDAELSNAQQGYPITYECGDGEKVTKCVLFNNAVRNINESVNAENILDKGFVLMSNFLYDNQYQIFPENEPLGWVKLHENLHLHGRFFQSGTMNNAATTFETYRKNKRLQEFTVPFCCGTEFDPRLLVLTSKGPAQVQRAEQNLLRQNLKLELNI